MLDRVSKGLRVSMASVENQDRRLASGIVDFYYWKKKKILALDRETETLSFQMQGKIGERGPDGLPGPLGAEVCD